MLKYKFSYIKNILNEFLEIYLIFLSLINNRHFLFLVFFSFIIIFLESYTLAIVYDVSNSILNNEFEINNLLLKWAILNISFLETSPALIIIITLVSFIFFKNIFSIFVIFFKNHFFRKIITKLSQILFNKFMKQNYSFLRIRIVQN